MALAHQIREQVAAFLINEQPLRSVTEWLADNIWMADTDESDARQLAGEVELIVVEYSNHHINQDELRRQLRDLLSFQKISANPDSFPVGTAINSTTSTNSQWVEITDPEPRRFFVRAA